MSLDVYIYYTSLFLLACCLFESALLLRKYKGKLKWLLRTLIRISRLRRKSGTKAVVDKSTDKIYGKVMDIINPGSAYEDEFLHVAFRPTGGMGDYIISAKILEELMEYGPCKIDVFAEKMVFGKAIYANRENVNVLPYTQYDRMRSQYDVALEVEHFIYIHNWTEDRVRNVAPKIHQRLRYILEHWDELYVAIDKQCWRERIQFERCRTLGLNRWTELRMGKAFAVSDMKVTIPMDDAFKEKLEEYPFYGKKYVTINYGADAMRIGMTQLKLWPKEHLESLVALVKENYPEIQVVQLGGRDATKITGVDVYVLGESIELTKWILKDSICHIDCEGGLVHLASQFDTKCIVIFGPTPVHMYGYPQNINLYSDECNNCMGLHEDWAYKCYLDYEQPECMHAVLPQLVFDEFQRYIVKHEVRAGEKTSFY